MGLRSDTVGKHQVPPYVGHSGVNSALLRGMIKGRAARFVQIGMRYRALCQAVKHELQLWIRAGWPPRVLFKDASGFPGQGLLSHRSLHHQREESCRERRSVQHAAA